MTSGSYNTFALWLAMACTYALLNNQSAWFMWPVVFVAFWVAQGFTLGFLFTDIDD